MGGFYVYLSPLIESCGDSIRLLVEEIVTCGGAGYAAPILSFLYPGGESQRILSHGYAIAPGGRIVPVMQAFPLESDGQDISVSLLHPYMLASRGPFYAESDRRGNFWDSHISACARLKNGLSLGAISCRLAQQAFPVYFRLCENALVSCAADLVEIAKENGLRIEMTPYNSFYFADDCIKDISGDDEEGIFWKLLVMQRPELVSLAAADIPARQLKVIARAALYRSASISYQEACRNAGNFLSKEGGICESYGQWHDRISPDASLLYAASETKFTDIFRQARNPFIAIRNFLHIVACGIFGFGVKADR